MAASRRPSALFHSAFLPATCCAREFRVAHFSEKINIQVDEDRRLQLLDDSAQELHDAVWSVSDRSLPKFRKWMVEQ